MCAGSEQSERVVVPARAPDAAVDARKAAAVVRETEPHCDLETTRKWLESMMASSPEVSEDFVIEHEGAVVGKAGFYRLPEIGFILRRELWGRGLALEATRAVIDHVFATRNVEALSADVDPRNAASMRLLERLGFVETGRAQKTYCVGGVWTDSVYFTLRRMA